MTPETTPEDVPRPDEAPVRRRPIQMSSSEEEEEEEEEEPSWCCGASSLKSTEPTYMTTPCRTLAAGVAAPPFEEEEG